METEISNLEPEEITLYLQIEKYINSQNIIKEIINKGQIKEIEIELYLINDDWLNKWKEYSYLNYFDFKDIKKDPQKWSNNRKNGAIRNKKLESIKNQKLIQFDNKSINYATLMSFDPTKYFHLVTKDCFDSFTEGMLDKEFQEIKYKFTSKNKKIMALSENKIIVLFQNFNLNLVIFILENPIYCNFYSIIKEEDIEQYLYKFGIDSNTKEKKIEIKEGNIKYKIFFMNKSYIYKNKKEDIYEQNLKGLIQNLINFDKEFNLLMKNNSINQKILYLIDSEFIYNIKTKLNYNDFSKNYSNEINKLKNTMVNRFIENSPETGEEINPINEEKKIFKYLQQNGTEKIIKICTNYTLINEKIWKNLTNLYNYHNEIKVKCFFKGNFFLITYNTKNLEIFKYNNNKCFDNLLFCFYKEQNIEQIVKEIFSMKTTKNLYDCINIFKTNEIFKKIIDHGNNSNEIGIVINLKIAIKENNFFKIINKDKSGKNSEYEIGLNKSISETTLFYQNIIKKSFIGNNDKNLNLNMNNYNTEVILRNSNNVSLEKFENNNQNGSNAYLKDITNRKLDSKEKNNNNFFQGMNTMEILKQEFGKNNFNIKGIDNSYNNQNNQNHISNEFNNNNNINNYEIAEE